GSSRRRRVDLRERLGAVLERRPAQRLRRPRGLEPGLGLAVREHLLERRAEVERERLAALGRLPRALRLGRREVGLAVLAEHDVVAPERLLARDEPERDVALDRRDGSLEPVLPAAE